MCVGKFATHTHINLQSDDMDPKSVELRFMSVRVGLGVPFDFFYSNFVSARCGLVYSSKISFNQALLVVKNAFSFGIAKVL